MMTDFALIIGEALVDLVKRADSNEEPTGHPGGSPLNVALTLGRLGRPVELVTWVGPDGYGQQILDHVTESGVLVKDEWKNAHHTATALALLDQSGAATYQFDIDWDIPHTISIPSEAVFVHSGSLGAALKPGRDRVLEAFELAHETALVSFDPNARPTIMDPAVQTRPVTEAFVRNADLVKVSDEDLHWLYPDLTTAEAIAHWFDISSLGLAVLTQGKEGPVAWTREGLRVERRPSSVDVVDTVGAGDSFMGSLINSLWARNLTGRAGAKALGSLSVNDLSSILDEANAVANVTVSRAGANPPWAHEL